MKLCTETGKKIRTFAVLLTMLVILACTAMAAAACGGSEDEPAVPEESGYKIACLGDSITDGTGVEDSANRYTDRIAADGEIASVQNLGFPATFIGYSSSQDFNPLDNYSFLKRYTKIEEGTDLIFVFGGTNDYGSANCNPVGEKGDETGYTFYGALKLLITGIREAYPDAQLLFATPLQRDDVWYGEPSTTPYNEAGNTLEDYRDAIVDMCTGCGVEYIDFYNLEGMRLEDATFADYSYDGLHPNDAGHKVIADALLPKIKSMLSESA